MKAIQLRKNLIEIPFQNDKGEVELTLYFDKSDENIKRLHKSINELNDLKDIKEDDFDEAKKVIKKITDSIFGNGSFDKLYELNPSIQIIGVYLYQIAIGIKEEFEEEDLKDIERKYL